MPKTTFRTEIGGGWVRGASKKLGPPTYFGNRKAKFSKLATSNLVHNLGLGLAYQKTTFRTKIGGVWARKASEKIGNPYLFLKPLELATENGTQNEFR